MGGCGTGSEVRGEGDEEREGEAGVAEGGSREPWREDKRGAGRGREGKGGRVETDRGAEGKRGGEGRSEQTPEEFQATSEPGHGGGASKQEVHDHEGDGGEDAEEAGFDDEAAEEEEEGAE